MGPSPTSSLRRLGEPSGIRRRWGSAPPPLSAQALPAAEAELAGGQARTGSLVRCRPALGTFVKVSLHGGQSEEELLGHSLAAFSEIERIEGIMSFHDPCSELSLLNREAHLRPIPICREMGEVLRFGLRLSRLTDGAFDFTVASELVKRGALPDHGLPASPFATWRDVHVEDDYVRFDKPLLIDLGGIAKGYAVDCAISVLPQKLAVVVDAGGDLRMRPWMRQSVAIRVPRPRFGSRKGARRGPSLLEVPMRACAVATSASYFGRDGSSIICPNRRRPVEDTHSLSVFASTCMQADALTKVAFLIPQRYSLWRQVAAAALMVDESAQGLWLGRP